MATTLALKQMNQACFLLNKHLKLTVYEESRKLNYLINTQKFSQPNYPTAYYSYSKRKRNQILFQTMAGCARLEDFSGVPAATGLCSSTKNVQSFFIITFIKP